MSSSHHYIHISTSVCKCLLIMLCLCLDFVPVQAQQIAPVIKESTDSLMLRVYFRQSISQLEPTFRDNEERLTRFVSQVRKAVADSSYVIKDIIITSGASPEGTIQGNKLLSENRGKALSQYLQYALGVPDSIFRINAVGEDWDGLRQLVIKYNVPRYQDIVNIIDTVPQYVTKNGAVVDGRKKRLMDLDAGKVWNYMLEHIFPELRSSSNNVVCHIVKREYLVNNITRIYNIGDTIPHRTDTLYIINNGGLPVNISNGDRYVPNAGVGNGGKAVKPFKQYYFAAKSNMLFDIVSALNVELEFPIGNRYSLMVEHWFPWWIFGDDKHALEILYSGAEFRYWLGNRSDMSVLQGKFIGIYAGATKYDVEYNEKGYQGESVMSFGVTAGKSWRLSKHWRMEASLSVGYLHSDYRYYEHNKDVDLLIWKRNDTFNWIGPTKIKLSFGRLIGVKKTKKGGAK